MKKIQTICLMSLVALVFSCDTKPERDSLNPLGEIDAIKVVDGTLRFSSFSHFERVAAELTKNQSKTGLNAWQAKFTGFTSMRSAFKQLTETEMTQIGLTKSTKGYENFLLLKEDGNELEAVRVIDSDVLATIFNKDGVVRFGDDAYKYVEDKVYVIRNFTPQKLKSLSQVKEVIHLSVVNKRNARMMDARNECIVTYQSGGYNRLVGDYTLVTPLFGSNSGPFNRVKAAAKSQKRVLGVWFDNAIPRLHLEVTGATYRNYGPASINYNSPQFTNDADVLFEEGLDDGTGTAVVTWLQVKADGKCDDQAERNCTTRFN